MHNPFRLRGRRRVGPALAAIAVVGVLVPSAAADAALTIHGADASDTVDCRNIAPTSHGHGVQVNVCTASATGGTVSLQDVDVYFNTDSTVRADGGAVDIIHAVGGSATATTTCQNSAAHGVNICRAYANGGDVQFKNVEILLQHADGSVTSIERDLLALAPSRASHVRAVCTPFTSVSNCSGTASGAVFSINDVNVVDHASGTTRTHVNISLSGGDATATLICGNSGNVRVQINKCTATAVGGDVKLENVRLHVFQTS
jgi:hypothetical protein